MRKKCVCVRFVRTQHFAYSNFPWNLAFKPHENYDWNVFRRNWTWKNRRKKTTRIKKNEERERERKNETVQSVHNKIDWLYRYLLNGDIFSWLFFIYIIFVFFSSYRIICLSMRFSTYWFVVEFKSWFVRLRANLSNSYMLIYYSLIQKKFETNRTTKLLIWLQNLCAVYYILVTVL